MTPIRLAEIKAWGFSCRNKRAQDDSPAEIVTTLLCNKSGVMILELVKALEESQKLCDFYSQSNPKDGYQ